MNSWAVLEYEVGRHYAMMNSLARLNVVCLVPLVQEENRGMRLKTMRPALRNIAFIPDDESKIRIVFDRVRYAEKVWRSQDGRLQAIPDAQVQFFLDQLDKREKKPKALRKALNLSEATDKDWFDLLHKQFGLSTAIKRFGKDLSDREAA
jgi:hypothetical protein